MLRRYVGFALLILGGAGVVGIVVCGNMNAGDVDEILDAVISKPYPSKLEDLVPPYPNLKCVLPSEFAVDFIVTAETEDSTDAFLAFYEEKLPEIGWRHREEESEDPEAGWHVLSYEKEPLELDISIKDEIEGARKFVSITLTDTSKFYQAQHPDDSESRKLITEMLARYRSCKTYRDTGEEVTHFKHSSRSWKAVERFKTAFVRPDRLRVQSWDEDNTDIFEYTVLHADPSGTQKWDAWSRSYHTSDESISMLLPSPDRGTVVPSFLVNKDVIWPEQLLELGAPMEEEVNGVLCYRIDAKDRDGDEHILWITQDSRVLRMHEEHSDFKTFKTKSLTIWYPEIDVAISDEELAFRPTGIIPMPLAQAIITVQEIARSYSIIAWLLIMSCSALFLAGLLLFIRSKVKAPAHKNPVLKNSRNE